MLSQNTQRKFSLDVVGETTSLVLLVVPRTRYLACKLLLAIAISLVGCSSKTELVSESSSPATVAIVQGQSPSEEAKSKMLAAKEALFTKLSGRLMEVMSGQGPVLAIAVCQKEARQIAANVSDEHGLRIGRTGVRLRNPNNAAPSWAESLVRERIQTPTFAVLDSGDSAALLPIKLQGQCLMCHGPKDQIAPVVQDQLAKLYPNDEATGFHEGELRGWFWVEVDTSEEDHLLRSTKATD